MSLREDMYKYEQITGESAEHVPIIKLGAFLDGYELGIKDVLDDIRAEIKHHRQKTESIDKYDLVGDCLDIIDRVQRRK